MKLRFARLYRAAQPPSRARPGDAGYDLAAAESVRLEPGERASVGTGLAVAVPSGHAGLVLPRSGLALRHGLALVNSPGLIDSGYRGEVRVLLLNTDRRDAYEIVPGDRIAQLVIARVEAPELVEAPDLEGAPEYQEVSAAGLTEAPAGEPREAAAWEGAPRGRGGFGSSGR